MTNIYNNNDFIVKKYLEISGKHLETSNKSGQNLKNIWKISVNQYIPYSLIDNFFEFYNIFLLRKFCYAYNYSCIYYIISIYKQQSSK